MTEPTKASMRRSVWHSYVFVGCMSVGAYFLLPGSRLSHGILFTAGTIYGTVGVIAGIVLHRPRHALPWYLLGAGLLCWVGGSLLWNVYELVLRRAIPVPSFADPLFLAAYPLQAAGLLYMIRAKGRDGRAAWLDALVVSIGLGGLSWVFLMAPHAQNASLTIVQRLVSIAYPASDLILFALLVRLIMGQGAKRTSEWLLTAGLSILVVADSLWASRLLGGTYSANNPVYAGWLLFLVSWGAAALHPSMASLGEDVAVQERTVSPLRLLFLASAALAPLIIVALQSADFRNTNAIVLSAMSGLMFLLILSRARALMVDVRKLQSVQSELRASEEKYRHIVETTPGWVWEIDPQGRLTYSNLAVSKILGYTPEELLGQERFKLVHPDDRPEALNTLSEDIAERRTGWSGWTLRWRDKRGRDRWLESNAAPIFDASRSLIGYRGADRDVTERKKLEDEIAHQALYDSLTELPNRVLFRDRLEHALAAALRDGLSVCLLMIDLNGFKAINDTFGHPVGDEVLIQTSRRIRSCLRPGDTAARLGGDEFAVLLDGAGIEDAVAVAERILEAVRKPIQVDERELFIDASIGIGESPSGAVQAEAIIRDADAAMYAAKNDGKGGIETYRPELHNDVLKRFELVTDLRRALERQEFTLYYQPIVRLEDERILGVEALVRWLHPTRGLIPPLDFIPLAEQTGMVVHLDRWVMAEACRAVSRWRNEFPNDPPLNMSVNVSARQLQDPELTREVERSLRDAGLDSASLTLEITESVLMQDSEAAARVLQELKDLGVRLAIDDFGIGFSSLSYLRRLPVDIVKIDRSFVAGVASVSEEWTLARGIVKLVHGLGLETIAEGVERADQKAHLRSLGCRLGQGYYFARPMEEAALKELLAERAPRSA